MSLKISINHPDYPKDHEFDVRGVGLIKNKSTKTLSAEEEEALVTFAGMSVKEYFKDDALIKVDGTSEVKTSAVLDEGEGGEK